jgi:hypothetical protein
VVGADVQHKGDPGGLCISPLVRLLRRRAAKRRWEHLQCCRLGDDWRSWLLLPLLRLVSTLRACPRALLLLLLRLRRLLRLLLLLGLLRRAAAGRSTAAEGLPAAQQGRALRLRPAQARGQVRGRGAHHHA